MREWDNISKTHNKLKEALFLSGLYQKFLRSFLA
jgi:hypothetical protein